MMGAIVPGAVWTERMPEAEKIERLLASPTAQWLFRRMTAKKPGGRCWLEEFF